MVNGLELCKRALCAMRPGKTESSVQMGSDEDPREDKSQCRLSELFVDDAWGTAKSLPSLKQHSDHKKWLQRSGLSVKAFKDLEKRLSVYEVGHLKNAENQAIQEGLKMLLTAFPGNYTLPLTLLSTGYVHDTGAERLRPEWL